MNSYILAWILMLGAIIFSLLAMGMMFQERFLKSLLCWAGAILCSTYFTEVVRPMNQVIVHPIQVIGEYTLDEVDVEKNPETTTEVDLTMYNALIIKDVQGTFTQTQRAFKGGSIYLHDENMTELKIDVVRQSMDVKQPTFKRTAKVTETIERFPVSRTLEETEYKLILYVPYQENFESEAQKE